MSKFKEQWNNYFEGGIEMWSYFGYQYHSYLIAKHVVSTLELPKRGYIIQIGTGLGITVEYLCNRFGEGRVIGYDLFNPLGHPNIEFLDAEQGMPTDIRLDYHNGVGLAYTDIDVGSMSHAKDTRQSYLEWALQNTNKGGYILTNKVLASELSACIEHSTDPKDKELDYTIHELTDFEAPEIWANPHQSRINTKVLIQVHG